MDSSLSDSVQHFLVQEEMQHKAVPKPPGQGSHLLLERYRRIPKLNIGAVGGHCNQLQNQR